MAQAGAATVKLAFLFLAALAWGQESAPPQPSLEQQQIAALKRENAQLRDALQKMIERHDKVVTSLVACWGPVPQVPPARPPAQGEK